MSSRETAEKFNVVILHDRFTSAGPAKAAFLRLRRESNGKFAPKLRVLRVEDAKSPIFAARSAGEIETAEMVIMAARGSHFIRLRL
jgi:hypothetical protein